MRQLALAAVLSTVLAYTPTPHGFVASVQGWTLELAVEGLSSFRLSALAGAAAPAQVRTSMIAPKAAYAPHNITQAAAAVSLHTPFGALTLDTSSGVLTLADAAGRVLAAAAAVPALVADPFASRLAAVGGQATTFTFAQSAGAFMGAGTDGPSARALPRTSVRALVENRGSWTPSFWSAAGWSMQAVSPYEDSMDGTDGTNTYPVQWAATPAGDGVAITVLGGDALGVDLYLTPAADLRAHVSAQAALQGAAPVPPRYAMGFFACRWGWVNQSYIEGVLAEFRSGGFPIDSMISDFEWFTAKPDYSLNETGEWAYAAAHLFAAV